MTDLTEGLGDWVHHTLDIVVQLPNGREFDNLKQPTGERIRCKVRILNHFQRQHYTALMKTITNLQTEEALDAKRQCVEENCKDWENLTHRQKPVKTGKEFYESQGSTIINYMYFLIISDIPLAPEEKDEDGQVVAVGDEKN